MAVVIGTSSGFCSATPSVDPNSTSVTGVNGYQVAGKFTSPAEAFDITALTWFQEDASCDPAAFSMGIYNDDADGDSGNGIPTTLVSAQVVGAMVEDSAQWLSVAADITGLTTSTTYWIAVGVAAASDAGSYGYESTGSRRHYKTVGSAPDYLTSPWGSSGGSSTDRLIAMAAVYEAASSGTTYPAILLHNNFNGGLL